MKGIKALKQKIEDHHQKTLDQLAATADGLGLDTNPLNIDKLDSLANLKLDLDPLKLTKKGNSHAADAKAKEKAAMNLAQRELDAHYEAIKAEDEATAVQRIVMRLGVDGFTSRPAIICVACFTGDPESLSCIAKYVTTAEELVAFNSGRVNNWPMRVVNTVVRNHVDEFFALPQEFACKSPMARSGEDAAQFLKADVRRTGETMGASSSLSSLRARCPCCAQQALHPTNPPSSPPSSLLPFPPSVHPFYRHDPLDARN